MHRDGDTLQYSVKIIYTIISQGGICNFVPKFRRKLYTHYEYLPNFRRKFENFMYTPT